MKCKRCEKRVYEYLDKALSTHRQIAVDKHLAHCPRCAEFYAREGRWAAQLEKGMETITSAIDIDMKRVETLQQQKRAQKKKILLPSLSRLLLKPAYLLLALCIVPLMVWILSHLIPGNNAEDISPTLLSIEPAAVLMSDALEDWTQRRMTITIRNREGKIYKQIITSKYKEHVFLYKKNNNNGG